MSPTQLGIRCAQLIKDLEIARTARDLPRMQELAGQHQRLAGSRLRRAAREMI
jgi:hypothetical protein